MEKDKILIIEKSDMIKTFLREKLNYLGFDTLFARDAFDGLVKMKNNIPDLVIMEYTLTENLKTNFFEEKRNYKTIADIPIFMLANKLDKDIILATAKYKVTKYFTKPIKIDTLLKSISETLQKDLNIDQTPCIIDVHLNDDILFIEIASGLNSDRIDSLKYKINEIKNIFRIDMPKILLIMVDISLGVNDAEKLYLLLDSLVKYANPHLSAIKILTSSIDVKSFLAAHSKYCTVEVTSDINNAIDKLSDIKIDDILNRGFKKTKDDELLWTTSDATFKEDAAEKPVSTSKAKIAIVDDDELILELVKTILLDTGNEIFVYKNGREFVDDIQKNTPDLIFLDIMMPIMNGFEVLEYMKKSLLDIPVVIFSTITHKETVRKALMYGIKSYIAKPVNPDLILKKANEILQSNF
jgi:DNA-binding response OmpR family regulator